VLRAVILFLVPGQKCTDFSVDSDLHYLIINKRY